MRVKAATPGDPENTEPCQTKFDAAASSFPSNAKLAVVVIFVALVAASPEANAMKINRFIRIVNSANQIERIEARAYFNGVLDTVMYANGTLFEEAGGSRMFCLPEDIPDRETLLQSFLQYDSHVRNKASADRMESVYVDQLLFAAFKNAYPCDR